MLLAAPVLRLCFNISEELCEFLDLDGWRDGMGLRYN